MNTHRINRAAMTLLHAGTALRVHQVNQVLRRLGASPRPPGVSPRVDKFRAPLGHLIGAARHRLRGNRTPPPGSC